MADSDAERMGFHELASIRQVPELLERLSRVRLSLQGLAGGPRSQAPGDMGHTGKLPTRPWVEPF